jgi:hypothetical protein
MVLEFLDINGNIPNFTNVTLDNATNYRGFTSSRITVAANAIFVNVADLPGLQGPVISVDIGSAAVPEPSSWIPAGTGLIALLFRAARKAIRSGSNVRRGTRARELGLFPG